MKIIYPLLALLSFNTYCTELLAGKVGAFENHDKCLIYDDRIKLQQGADLVNHISFTRLQKAPIQEFKNLAEVALSHAQKPTYRWSLGQVDYIANPAKEVFYARGFKNVANSSDEAQELIKLIDEHCNGPLPRPKILGKFELLLKTSQHQFVDYLTIESRRANDQQYVISGEYEVPGVFSSKVTQLKASEEGFSFKIHVKEGEHSYDTLFVGKFTSQNEIRGKAFTLPHREILGHFSGVRISHE